MIYRQNILFSRNLFENIYRKSYFLIFQKYLSLINPIDGNIQGTYLSITLSLVLRNENILRKSYPQLIGEEISIENSIPRKFDRRYPSQILSFKKRHIEQP